MHIAAGNVAATGLRCGSKGTSFPVDELTVRRFTTLTGLYYNKHKSYPFGLREAGSLQASIPIIVIVYSLVFTPMRKEFMALGLAGMLAGSEAKAAPPAPPKSAPVEVQRAAPKELSPDARSLQDLAARLDKSKKALNLIERRLGRTPEQFLDEAVRRLVENAQKHLDDPTVEDVKGDFLFVHQISEQAEYAFGGESIRLADSLRRLSPAHTRAPRLFESGITNGFDEESGENTARTAIRASTTAPRPFKSGVVSAFGVPAAPPPYSPA